MASNSICILVTEPGGLFVGSDNQYLRPLVDGQTIKKEVWLPMPQMLEDFFRKNPKEKDSVFKALHYWALCALKKLEYSENHYGTVKRKLSDFQKKLYSKIRKFAKSIATEFNRAFPPDWKRRKKEKRMIKYYQTHY